MSENPSTNGSQQRPHHRPVPKGASAPVDTATPERTAARPSRRREQPPLLARIVNDWWTRLLQAIYAGSLSDQEERYDSHRGGRDYLWNTIGTSVWGVTFPILTVIATQLAGTEEAGMFSMAFVVGTLLMIATNYGVRNFQVSDLDEANSFSSYCLHRWIMAALALLAGLLYGSLRGYGATMMTICTGVFIYKLIDGIADVYEGRLQQADKLYLAGISQTVRSGTVIVAFALALIITRSLAVAAIFMAVAAVASFIVVTLPLALFETEKSRPPRVDEVTDIFRQCFPLFCAVFLFNLIESVPKFVMEGAVGYENQLYFNALYFPAQGILLAAGALYKPQLRRLASIWASPRKRRRFDIIIVVVMAIILVITVVVGLVMQGIGLSVMSLLYGVDFNRFSLHATLMVAAGGVTAAIEFLYAIITILRRQEGVVMLYLISTVASVMVSLLLVNFLGLTGAVVSYLGTMTLLLVLLVLEYVRIRRAITRERNPFS